MEKLHQISTSDAKFVTQRNKKQTKLCLDKGGGVERWKSVKRAPCIIHSSTYPESLIEALSWVLLVHPLFHFLFLVFV